MDTPADSGTGSQLCTKCALCCMGVIHAAAVLDEAELSLADRLELKRLPTERPLFSLPCPRLQGLSCGVYNDRPKVCGRYKCQLLQNVEAGKATVDDALSKVSEAKRLWTDVLAIMPSTMTYTQAKSVAQRSVADVVVTNDAQIKLRVTALDHFIDTVFRNAADRKSFTSQSIELEPETHE